MQLSHSYIIKSKFLTAVFTILIAVSFILQTSTLEAGGWGKTDMVVEYEGVNWNEVYFDLNGLNLKASIPNHSGTILQNGDVHFEGKIKDSAYVIMTSFNPGFIPPGTIQEFLKMIQDANPSFRVSIADSQKIGARYAVDLIPLNQESKSFWRFISTDDRLIKFGTNDPNENYRLYFFESPYISASN